MTGVTSQNIPIKSMTGFARASLTEGRVRFEIEIRSVNHRHFDLTFRTPKPFIAYERELRSELLKNHRRGKIELTVSRHISNDTPEKVINTDERDTLIDQKVARYLTLCKKYNVPADGLPNLLMHLVRVDSSGIDEINEDLSSEVPLLVSAVSKASDQLLQMRATEGRWLEQDIRARIKTIEMILDLLKSEASKLPALFKSRLEARLKKIPSDIVIDPDRISTEVVFLIDRSDVSEELSRLESHLQQFRQALDGDVDGVGRKLDFLVQEIGREFNTIGSKAQDAQIQGMIVDGKTELEKIREQIQNIE